MKMSKIELSAEEKEMVASLTEGQAVYRGTSPADGVMEIEVFLKGRDPTLIFRINQNEKTAVFFSPTGEVVADVQTSTPEQAQVAINTAWGVDKNFAAATVSAVNDTLLRAMAHAASQQVASELKDVLYDSFKQQTLDAVAEEAMENEGGKPDRSKLN